MAMVTSDNSPRNATVENRMNLTTDRSYTPRLPALLASALLAGIAGCASHTSRDLSPEGQAAEIIFPDPADAVMGGGTFPVVDSVRAIGPGVTRDQLYTLVGRPHFNSGFKAREWDYLFNFRGEDGKVSTCQYKVIFDRDRLGQSFHWSPANCADLLKPVAAVAGAGPVSGLHSLPADTLFTFAKSGEQDILPAGRAELDRLAAQIIQAGEVKVAVIGHTDRIGSDNANLFLSERRAATVRQYLAAQGVPASAITSAGRGEREPIKDCADQAQAALIDCLAPNRRVEVLVKAR